MALPDVQSLMLPILRIHSDQKDHAPSTVMAELAKVFNLSENDLKERYAKGNGKVFVHRYHFSKMNLKAAGLIENPRKGVSRITSAGAELLRTNPSKLEFADLMKYPSYREFKKPPNTDGGGSTDGAVAPLMKEKSPEDAIELGYAEIQRVLIVEILDRISKCSPEFFEELVVALLVKMGYGGSVADAGKAIGKSGDEGIDGVIKEDRLGLDSIYIQAKRWKSSNTVGRPSVQEFVGAVTGKHGKKGVFITTSKFTQDAREFVEKVHGIQVVLIDGELLASLMIEHNVGVSEKQVFKIKKIDSDYFSEEE